MGYFHRLLVLTFCWASFAYADTEPNTQQIRPGDMLPDLTMKSMNGFGQSLKQARGKHLMLIWLGDCSGCENEIIQYQFLAESFAFADLEGWFIWEPKGRKSPPDMRIPVLKYEKQSSTSWLFEDRPAVMLVSPEGRLDHLILGDLEENYKEVELVLIRWISSD